MGILVQARIHRQNIGQYCGAACAQMTLAALGLDPRTLAQREIYQASHITGDHWFARPDMLTSALNARWSDANNLRFRLFRCADKAGLLEVMCRMFEQFGENGAVAIALWEASRHWVVVRGFETDPADTSKVIGLHLRNPLPPIGGEAFADREHAHDDDCCAEHGKCYFCHYVSIANWNTNLHPVTTAGIWKGEYLVICPDTGVPGLPDEVMVPPTLDLQAEPAQPTGPILSTEEITARIERMVAEDWFVGVDCIVEGVRFTAAGTPILVQELNDDGSVNPDGAYYLVPFLDENGDWGSPGSVPMAMAINAFTGEFEEVVAAPDGSIYQPDWISPAGIERQASSNNLDPLRNRAQPDSDFPFVAVWRPSEQTPTRFWPLFVEDRPAPGDAEDDAASRVSPPVYMRIDGQVITSLDDLRP